MDLEIGSGGTLNQPATKKDILANLHRAGVTAMLLSSTPGTFLRCVRVTPDRWRWWRDSQYSLVYQDGAAEKCCRAVGEVSEDVVVSTFLKYLRHDSSWMTDFRWKPVDGNAGGPETSSKSRKNPFSALTNRCKLLIPRSARTFFR
jgi:hypothetical protein